MYMNSKHLILTVAMFSTACGASSCSTANKNDLPENNTVITTVETIGSHANEYTRAAKTVKVEPFTALTNKVYAKITLREGKEYKVEMKGDETALANTRVYVEDNTLVFEKKDKHTSKNDREIEFVVYCPKISGITNMGKLTLCSKITGFEALEIDNSGLLNMDCSKLSRTKSLKISNRGKCEIMNFKTISAEKMSFDNSGIINVSVNDMKCDEVDVKNHGQFTLSANNINSSMFHIENVGLIECKAKASGKNVDITNKGKADITVGFTGEKVEVNNSGVGNISLNVDCRHLDAKNSGNADFKISGTAEDTSISGTGISKINTKELNKF